MGVVSIALKALTIDLNIQPRERGLDVGHADEIAAVVKGGQDMPPIRVFRTPTGEHVVSRGFHRCEGYARAGKTHIPAEVKEGTYDDAALDAAASAPEHRALKFTTADKRRAVATVLRIHGEWSDRRVADHVGVHNETVAAVRRESAPQLSDSDSSKPQVTESVTSKPVTRVGKDGKKYKVASKPKAKPQVSESDTSKPKEQAGGGDCSTPGEESGRSPGATDSGVEPVSSGTAPAGQPADPAAEFVGRINRHCTLLDAAAKEAEDIAAVPVYGRQVHGKSVATAIRSARKALWQSRPTEPCNCVKGGGPAKPECRACFGAGVCPASRVLKGGR